MKIRYSNLFKLIFPVSVLISYPAFAQTDALQNIFGGSITLKEVIANTADLDYKNGIGFFSGDVEVTTYEGMALTCNKLEIYYSDTEGAKKGNRFRADNIEKIIATENVRIDQPGEDMTATAERAEYNKADETVLLTGNPIFKLGDNEFSSSNISVDLIDSRIIVESPHGMFSPVQSE